MTGSAGWSERWVGPGYGLGASSLDDPLPRVLGDPAHGGCGWSHPNYEAPSTRQSSGKHPGGLVTLGLTMALTWSPRAPVCVWGGLPRTERRMERNPHNQLGPAPPPPPPCKCPRVLAQLFWSQGRAGLSTPAPTCPAVPILSVFRHICKCVFVSVCRVGVGAELNQPLALFFRWAWGQENCTSSLPCGGSESPWGAPGCVAPSRSSVWSPRLGHVPVGRPQAAKTLVLSVIQGTIRCNLPELQSPWLRGQWKVGLSNGQGPDPHSYNHACAHTTHTNTDMCVHCSPCTGTQVTRADPRPRSVWPCSPVTAASQFCSWL